MHSPAEQEASPLVRQRKYHKKSHYGCYSCKRRKIKVRYSLCYSGLLFLILEWSAPKIAQLAVIAQNGRRPASIQPGQVVM